MQNQKNTAKLIKIERTGYSDYYKAQVQGALVCTCYAPRGKQNLAVDLANMIANGCTRRAAGIQMAREGYDASGIRVASAYFVQ